MAYNVEIVTFQVWYRSAFELTKYTQISSGGWGNNLCPDDLRQICLKADRHRVQQLPLVLCCHLQADMWSHLAVTMPNIRRVDRALWFFLSGEAVWQDLEGKSIIMIIMIIIIIIMMMILIMIMIMMKNDNDGDHNDDNNSTNKNNNDNDNYINDDDENDDNNKNNYNNNNDDNDNNDNDWDWWTIIVSGKVHYHHHFHYYWPSRNHTW